VKQYKMRRFVIVIGGVVFLCLFYKDAFAAAPSLPSGQDLEAQAERFRSEYSQERRSIKETGKPSVRFEEDQTVLAPETVFELKSVRVTGTTYFDPARFSFIWGVYIGKTVGNYDLNKIAHMIKRVYKDLGYLTTLVYFPPQDIKNGEVEICVVEGKRADLIVEGNIRNSSSSIAKYIHTFRGELLDMGEIQKDMMRLNDNQDLKVSSVLSAGKKPETVDVTLKVKESFPYHVSAGIDNQGSRLTGRYRESLALNTSNLTGHRDELSVNAVLTKLSSGQFIFYEAPVGTYGTKLGMEAGFFRAKLGEEYRDYDITTVTQFYNPHASFELYRSQDFQADLRTGLKINNVRKKQAADVRTNERLRLPYVALDIVENDEKGQTNFSPELSVNTPGLMGASRRDNPLASRAGTDVAFVKYAQTINRSQLMPWNSYIEILSRFQTASHTLPSSEQMQLGGVNSIRGYPEGDFLADMGASLNMNWHFPLYFVSPSFKVAGFNIREQVDPILFFDIGEGWLFKTERTETGSKFLAGVGGGFSIHVRKNAHLKLQWAKAVGDEPIHGAGSSVFSVSFQCGF
jgi:hemolysin activation/secretion protein